MKGDGELWGETLVCFLLYFCRWGGCVDASHYSSPPFPDSSPVALTSACTGYCHYGQLWTDGWHRAGQYVMPDGVLQEIWKFPPQRSLFRFCKGSKVICCVLYNMSCEYSEDVAQTTFIRAPINTEHHNLVSLDVKGVMVIFAPLLISLCAHAICSQSLLALAP